MKSKFIITSFEIPLYRGKLVLVLSNDKEKVNEILEINDFDDEKVFAHCLLDNYGKKNTLPLLC